MQKIDSTRQKRRYLALSFFVPFGVMLLCFILGGLWPFGDRQVLAHDMWHQYYPFFVSFREKLRSGGSLQYLREAGMGIGYLPLYAYYLSSPLYLLSVLIPAALLRDVSKRPDAFEDLKSIQAKIREICKHTEV